jgi:hypothetical protein
MLEQHRLDTEMRMEQQRKDMDIRMDQQRKDMAIIRDVIKDEIGGKLPSGRPRASAFTPRMRFYPRTGFYRPRTR